MISRETGLNPEEREQKIAGLIKPFEQIVQADAFKSGAPGLDAYIIELQWKEPSRDKNGEWNTYEAKGPLNNRVIDYVKAIYNHWDEKALVNVTIKQIQAIVDDEQLKNPDW